MIPPLEVKGVDSPLLGMEEVDFSRVAAGVEASVEVFVGEAVGWDPSGSVEAGVEFGIAGGDSPDCGEAAVEVSSDVEAGVEVS